MENPFSYFHIGNLLVDRPHRSRDQRAQRCLARPQSLPLPRQLLDDRRHTAAGDLRRHRGWRFARRHACHRFPLHCRTPGILYVCLVAGTIGMLAAYNRGQQFRDRAFQLMTAFSLPWYAVVGVQKGLDQNLPIAGRHLPRHGRSDRGALSHRHHLPPTGQAVRAGRVVRDSGRADRGCVSHLRTVSRAFDLAGDPDLSRVRFQLPGHRPLARLGGAHAQDAPGPHGRHARTGRGQAEAAGATGGRAVRHGASLEGGREETRPGKHGGPLQTRAKLGPRYENTTAKTASDALPAK